MNKLTPSKDLQKNKRPEKCGDKSRRKISKHITFLISLKSLVDFTHYVLEKLVF